jgi:Domain of unknown function (DUF4382)
MTKIRLSSIILGLGLLGMLLLVGCSGGNGTGPTDPTVTTSDSGTVALYLKDGPLEDYDEIFVTITKVALIPAEENGENDDDMEAYTAADPVVIFESQEGEEVDLLSYRDEPYLFLVDDTIPAGRYAKIRLWISDVQPVGTGPCADEEMEIKLPSGKIDLNPRGGFEVIPGEALAIELDLDLDKSIQMDEAGNSGKCVFRPVIFVDIFDHPSAMPACPRIISGSIDALVYGDDELVVGFDMLLANSAAVKRPVPVIADAAVVFDGSGKVVNLNSLQIGDDVNVRGKLNQEGVLDATLVVVGDVATVKGVVLSEVDRENIFRLALDENQVVIGSGEALDVYVPDQTFVVIGCDDEVENSFIQPGMEALVMGKIDTSGIFFAALVVLRPQEISGALVAMEPEAGGHQLTVRMDTDDSEPDDVSIFLPGNVWPHIKGDGLLPLGMLSEIVACDNRPPVEIKLEPGELNIAEKLAVIPFEITGTVLEDADPTDDLIALAVNEMPDPVTIQTYTYATIIDENGSLATIQEIGEGDTITSHGLESCRDDVTQISFVISIQGEPAEIPY